MPDPNLEIRVGAAGGGGWGGRGLARCRPDP